MTDRLAARWHAGFVTHFDTTFGSRVFAAMSEWDAANERICVCDYRYYPFLGSRRQYSVCRPLWIPTPDDLAAYVAAQQATVVIARTLDVGDQQRYAGVMEGITSRTDLFEIFYDEDGKYIAVRVKSP
jgi:hypothetical protein